MRPIFSPSVRVNVDCPSRVGCGTLAGRTRSGFVSVVAALNDFDFLFLALGRELRRLGLMPYRLGQPCDAAIVHTDHPAYAALAPSDLPGVRALVDGRAITDPGLWAAIPRRVLGVGAAERPGRHTGHDHAGRLVAGDDRARSDHGG